MLTKDPGKAGGKKRKKKERVREEGGKGKNVKERKKS